MEYTQTPTDDLIPYANNSRTHSDTQVLQIASSIKEFGFLNPVLIDKDNGIIAGHGRVMAAKKLGLDTVPTLLVDHLTEAQKKAYVIADNQLALNSGWDFDLLKVEIEGLQEVDFDTQLLGFDDSFLDKVLDDMDFQDESDPKEASPEDDEIGIYVFVKSETEQQNISEEMEKRGYKCKLIG
jgi:ParB-like chromosome segregation protein Spo0J